MSSKLKLYARGLEHINRWSEANKLDLPDVRRWSPRDWNVSACAYYRSDQINICIERCAIEGQGGANWSFPGYVIDRTPYGVLAHELGHRVDRLRSERKGSYFGDFSVKLRQASGEDKITNYCPNDAEWFAEQFRLFVTNADLLKQIRPKTYTLIRDAGYEPITEGWRFVLKDASARTLAQANKKIAEAETRFI